MMYRNIHDKQNTPPDFWARMNMSSLLVEAPNWWMHECSEAGLEYPTVSINAADA